MCIPHSNCRNHNYANKDQQDIGILVTISSYLGGGQNTGSGSGNTIGSHNSCNLDS